MSEVDWNSGREKLTQTVVTSTEMEIKNSNRHRVTITFKETIPKHEYYKDKKRQVGVYEVNIDKNKTRLQEIIKEYNDELTLESDYQENEWEITTN